ncbi:substrate-binding domain-containing protein [Nakamurella sp. A5-74]|uniref:Substrate-binding domain-containing protein n=1 Tax=Nakamurella sp. A5-74 TaxID=3158264 RepID=A0AAU8DTI5_9ACTN
MIRTNARTPIPQSFKEERTMRMSFRRTRTTAFVAIAAATALLTAACSQDSGTGASTPATTAPVTSQASSPATSSDAMSTDSSSTDSSSSETPSDTSSTESAPSSSGSSSSGSSSSGSSSSGSSSAPSSSSGSTGDASFTLPAEKPAGAKDKLKVALVRQSGIGDYFEQWGSGAQAQLKAAGATVDVYDARNDNAKQATDFDSAIASKPDVIIVDHGLKDTIDPKVDAAITAGIPVVVYDVAISNEKALYLSQDDASIASKILGYLKEQNPDGGKIAYVNVSGIAPLDSRDAVYKQFLKDNPTFTQSTFFGKYSESVASDTASEGVAALQSAPDTTIAFAAYDELAKGTLIALRQVGMTKVSVYGVDISTADIGLMTEAGSLWKATAATDPANVGAIVARAAVAAGDGVDLPSKMVIPAALITQDLLKEKNVTDMAGLRKALPDLNTPEYLGASWIPEITPGQ